MPFISLNGLLYHYRIPGRAPQNAPAVVCIHGSGATGVVWSYQVSRLGKHFRIIVPDLPGHGESGGTTLDSAWAYAQWLNEFVQSIHISSFYLCGHSFGGAIVQEYARCFPHKIRGLILVCTGIRFSFSRAYAALHQDNADHDALLSILPASFRQAYTFLKSVSNATLHADLMAAATFDSSTWIETIRIPTLIMYGENDRITPKEMPQKLAQKIPGAILQVIPTAGHVVMTETPDLFNMHVKNFIEKCENNSLIQCLQEP